MASTHSHVTITILPCSLSLVHIPRTRITELSRPILKQILRKQPTFLNLTANEIELSIFAEDEEVADFEPIARRDRQRQRVREREARAGTAHRRRLHPSRSQDEAQPVEISFEKWKVLQIDAHEDDLSNSGSRVRELSAPLAAAGISILYQSSYMSDFIFVKESRLAEVMQLLDANGFSLYNSDPHGLGTTSLLDDLPEGQLVEEANVYGYSYPGSPGTASPHPRDGAVLSRTRSPSLASLTALSLAMSRSATLEDLQAVAAMAKLDLKLPSDLDLSGATSPATRTPKKSMSPTAAPVEVLCPDIACVGLTESAADVWGIKILTLVGYPELIPSSSASSPTSARNIARIDNSPLAESFYSSAFSNPRIRNASPAPEGLSPTEEMEHPFGVDDALRTKRFVVGGADPSSSSSSPGSLSSCSSDEDEEEYFSSSSHYTRTRDNIAATLSTPSLVSSVSQSSARSLPERLDMHYRSGDARSALCRFQAERRRSSSSKSNPIDLEQDKRRHSSASSSESRSRETTRAASRVPFFSFTRTAEGSSLTTDLGVLAALFGPEERHMLISQGGILDAGDELNEEAAAGDHYRRRSDVFDLDGDDLFEQRDDVDAPGTMKCLQIDLRKFGLEKHGLVNRFSRVLEDNGINHMYSSTIKTANLLVDKGNARRARSLLRSC